MGSSVLLGKRLRRQIREKAWPVLREAGFVEFRSMRAYRPGEGVVDVVEFRTFRPEWNEPRWLGGEAYANGGTFALLVGTYFLDADESPRPRCHECHRCTRLAHETVDCPVDGRTFWPGKDGEKLEAIVDEAIRVLKGRGLDVLSTHAKNDPCSTERFEEIGLSHEEAEEMMRICREGRVARSGALDGFHRRVHLADERLVA